MLTMIKLDLKTLWKLDKPLTATGILMAPVLFLTLLGLLLDPRILTAMPIWLKPAKFAISISLYTLTLAWIFQYLSEWPRLRRVTGWITAISMVIEMVIVGLQAARGKTSHFNYATLLDSALFSIMAVAILIAWFAAIAITVVLFRQQFADPVMGWALRIGLLISVIGAGVGGLMTAPTTAQLADAKVTHQMPVIGAHTVGAPDGGPGIPGTGWSREHGDLRVPHFFGLHAVQFLPLITWLLRPKRASTIIVAGSAYALLFVMALAQALMGHPFLVGLL